MKKVKTMEELRKEWLEDDKRFCNKGFCCVLFDFDDYEFLGEAPCLLDGKRTLYYSVVCVSGKKKEYFCFKVDAGNAIKEVNRFNGKRECKKYAQEWCMREWDSDFYRQSVEARTKDGKWINYSK